ncbi:MAG: hypothetical protein AUI36_11850 [Cyanobacteria bacterium 13_1_40CM_2_61_4]|nr:MAG: hypothetical protein AUI36_11850 [Cyanobacteria bacterium 13_1_40CM_2_61_4]
MISKSDFDALVERKAVPDSPVLSVYLDIDQSKSKNLKRRFEASLKDMLRSIEACFRLGAAGQGVDPVLR